MGAQDDELWVTIHFMVWKPSVTVAAIVERDRRFLLVEEAANGRVVFNQPAGHLEPEETLLDAVKREVLEETGWHFLPEAMVGIYLYPDRDEGVTYLRICFLGSCHGHEPDRPPDEAIIRVIWLTLEELMSMREKLRSPMVLHCIDDYRKGRRYPLTMLNHYLPAKSGASTMAPRKRS
ncbi:MAG: NUDIX hydrolase [Gammaproteobacteria bacterium]|nr:NUDIX hydrolase [Gammaproteobacteria bacterium]MCI0591512.1 NUDIX hydrolase [Gammaproteobacteria bacterium]